MSVQLYFDGSCEPKNPGGIACCGWVIIVDGVEHTAGGKFVCRGDGATNNVAEYAGLEAVLIAADNEGLGDRVVEVYGDSALVIHQITGRWRCHKDHLRQRLGRIRALLNVFPSWGAQWLPREDNEAADAQCDLAYATYCRNNGLQPSYGYYSHRHQQQGRVAR